LSNLAHALTLADILTSRTGLIYDHQLTGPEVERAAGAVAAHLGWTQDDINDQVAALKSGLSTIYQTDLADEPPAWSDRARVVSQRRVDYSVRAARLPPGR
jgi:hypothetical protein